MSTAHPICIIGSGLSGVSAAKALVARDADVLMIDPGIDLDRSVAADMARIGNKPAWRWLPEERDKLKSGVQSTAKGVKQKRLFGSDFACKGLDCFPYSKQDAAFYTSFATCGLGNIWGAGLLPMHQDDMTGWPITYDDLQPHYQSVLSFMPLSGQHDRLEKLFPLEKPASWHAPSRQTARMLARMERHADHLEKQGLYFGGSRLAGRFHGRAQGYDCQYCGMCLYGCPYGIIYTARETLEVLRQHPRFRLHQGLVATGLNQSGDAVHVHVTDTEGRQMEPVRAQRVFLACGPFATARIMLETMKKYDTPLQIKTTDQYYHPFLSPSSQPDIDHEKLHTMCQAFWVVKNTDISPHLIHSSLYTYNDLYLQALQNLHGPLAKAMKPVIRQVLGRLCFSITYLHSNHSATLEVRLQQDAPKTLTVQGRPNPDSVHVFRKLKKYWRRLFRYTGQYPAPFYNGARLPGAGNHNGGSFPMSKAPEGFETDTLGRVAGLDRVHIVDSSVLPNITATTVTYTVMANSKRISNNSFNC